MKAIMEIFHNRLFLYLAKKEKREQINVHAFFIVNKSQIKTTFYFFYRSINTDSFVKYDSNNNYSIVFRFVKNKFTKYAII